jgi:hypothetical protein
LGLELSDCCEDLARVDDLSFLDLGRDCLDDEREVRVARPPTSWPRFSEEKTGHTPQVVDRLGHARGHHPWRRFGGGLVALSRARRAAQFCSTSARVPARQVLAR